MVGHAGTTASATRRGRRGALVHYDPVDQKCSSLTARRAKLTAAITSGGATPGRWPTTRCMLEPDGHRQSRQHVWRGFSRSRATPATSSSSATRATASGAWSHECASRGRAGRAADDSILGSARHRGAAAELSDSVSRLRQTIAAHLLLCAEHGREASVAWLVDERASPQAGQAPSRSSTTSRSRSRRSARCRRATRWCSSASSTRRAACTGSSIHSLRYGGRINRGLGARAPQALLPEFRFRAASGRERGQYRALARPDAQLRGRGRVALRAQRDRARRARASVARGADVRHALALERAAGAGRAALPRGPARCRRSLPAWMRTTS